MESVARAAANTHPLRVLRAGQWLHFLPLPAAAIGPAQLHDSRAALELAVAAVAAGSVLAFTYGLNAVADRGSDLSPVKNPLVRESARNAAGASDVVGSEVWLALGFVLVAALGSAATLGLVTLVACVSSLVCGTLYSVGPRLKRVPLIGLLANLGVFLPLLAFSLKATEPPPTFALLCATFSALLLQNQLLHESADLSEDERAGDLTTARWLGAGRVRFSLALLGAAGALGALMLAPTRWLGWLGACAVLLSTAVALFGSRKPADRRVQHRMFSALSGALLFAAGLLWL